MTATSNIRPESSLPTDELENALNQTTGAEQKLVGEEVHQEKPPSNSGSLKGATRDLQSV